MVKIYIAGPDVFELDSIEIGRNYKNLCNKHGFIGLYPLDNEVNFNQKPQKIAQDIYQANIQLINDADIVIANLNAFRGKEADSGTVWECGYAYALGKKVYAYMENTQEYIKTFQNDETIFNKEHGVLDLDNRVIEDFGLPINLMLGCSITKIYQGDFETVLKSLATKQTK